MTMIAITAIYTLVSIGVYRGFLHAPWRQSASIKVKWKARCKVALLAAIWPMLVGKQIVRSKVFTTQV